MTLQSFRDVLEAAAQVHSDSGNQTVAESLRMISDLFAGRDTMKVAAFAKLLSEVKDEDG
jgi:hypothetical protein